MVDYSLIEMNIAEQILKGIKLDVKTLLLKDNVSKEDVKNHFGLRLLAHRIRYGVNNA